MSSPYFPSSPSPTKITTTTTPFNSFSPFYPYPTKNNPPRVVFGFEDSRHHNIWIKNKFSPLLLQHGQIQAIKMTKTNSSELFSNCQPILSSALVSFPCWEKMSITQVCVSCHKYRQITFICLILFAIVFTAQGYPASILFFPSFLFFVYIFREILELRLISVAMMGFTCPVSTMAIKFL